MTAQQASDSAQFIDSKKAANGKYLFIAEKPSVAMQFAEVLKVNLSPGGRKTGFFESDEYIITWCFGHLITMSYPDAYDKGLKSWRIETLPFLPQVFKYEIIEDSRKQFELVSGLLNRSDVIRIYVCTDSGREGEYIYRLVDKMAGVGEKDKRRVWIDSQTQEEILRGIREARPESEYDKLSASAFCRAREDYLMGINFSRALTLRFGNEISRKLGRERTVVSAGRVMTCVLGMIVKREEEIRSFKKTKFYKVIGEFKFPNSGLSKAKKAEAKDAVIAKNTEAQKLGNQNQQSQQSEEYDGIILTGEFRPSENSKRYSPVDLYKNSGFLKKEKAEEFIISLTEAEPENVKTAVIEKVDKKKEKKFAPLLYNLAELQNDCSKAFKISPERTLEIAQELYEKKLCTYPRTDARFLSSAIAKEIDKNLNGLCSFAVYSDYARSILGKGSYRKIAVSKYTNDSKITDHYAIIPTGQGSGQYSRLSELSRKIYDLIVRRFLSVFYPNAVFQKITASILYGGEEFVYQSKLLIEEGYLCLYPKKENKEGIEQEIVGKLRKGRVLSLSGLSIKEGETSPPKRYTSGSMILAMENAGKLIEDEDLRSQIKGSGIGTSATRASILTKLVKIEYIALDNKSQVLSPTKLGEMVTLAVKSSVKQLLNPELTASWEKGLSYVADGKISEGEYMDKLCNFVGTKTRAIISKRSNYGQ